MDIILREDIENLGFKDEVISVKPGYARNYLIPKGLAVLATKSAIKVLEENLRQRSVKEKKIKDDAQATADALAKLEIKIPVKSGEKGKMFGSVTSNQLVEAIEKNGLKVDKKYVKVKGEPIKNLGKFEATIRLHREVSAVINFDVVADK